MSFKFSWHWCHWIYTSWFPFFLSWKNIVKEINHFVKVCLTIIYLKCHYPSVCVWLFWLIGKSRIVKRGESLCEWSQTSMFKWGLRESVVEATAKSERSRTHYPPASTRANIPQRRQLVRNSFCLSLSHFPRCRATFMNLNHQPSFPLCLHSLFVSVLSQFPCARVSGSCSNGIVCLYRSTSIATSAAVKGNRTEVTGTLLCLFFSTLPLSCYRFYSLSWLSLTDLYLFPCILLALCSLITCPSLHFLSTVYELQFSWKQHYF